jgi:hypothetical protein
LGVNYASELEIWARELAKELYCKSREFYELVMLAIDMTEGVDDLVVTINLSGFVKKILTSELSPMSCTYALRESR